MKRFLILLAALALTCCTKDVPVSLPHDFSAEFPAEKNFSKVSVTIAGDGTVTAEPGTVQEVELLKCRMFSLKDLRVVTGTCEDLAALVEESFWKESSAKWIFALRLSRRGTELEELAFADYLRWKYSEDKEDGLFLYVSSNVFDKMSGFSLSENGLSAKFNIELEEE